MPSLTINSLFLLKTGFPTHEVAETPKLEEQKPIFWKTKAQELC